MQQPSEFAASQNIARLLPPRPRQPPLRFRASMHPHDSSGRCKASPETPQSNGRRAPPSDAHGSPLHVLSVLATSGYGALAIDEELTEMALSLGTEQRVAGVVASTIISQILRGLESGQDVPKVTAEEDSIPHPLTPNMEPEPTDQNHRTLGQSRLFATPPRLPSYPQPLDSSPPRDPKKLYCVCKKSRCLKKWCQCFALGKLCDGCFCFGCENVPNFKPNAQDEVGNCVKQVTLPDPLEVDAAVSAIGCTCKRSRCRKKYCTCFQMNMLCSSKCQCRECKNSSWEDRPADRHQGPKAPRVRANKRARVVEPTSIKSFVFPPNLSLDDCSIATSIQPFEDGVMLEVPKQPSSLSVRLEPAGQC